MALCLAESLVERVGFDPVDQLERYARWLYEGYLSSTGELVDVGNATRAAIVRFERFGDPHPGDANPRAAGNGPLMKLAPVAMAYAGSPAVAVKRAADSARTTHGAPEAADSCRYFAGLLVGALNGVGADALLAAGGYDPLEQVASLHPKVGSVAAGSFREAEPPRIRGGGYIVESLEAALWALSSTSTFREGVLAAANLGNDADTTAAVYGQLAGAIYGINAIPEHWRKQVFMLEQIIALADALLSLAGSINTDAAAEHPRPQRTARAMGQQPTS
jgi:ADP-ribosyl-[dinitrogen reductase] hydrolase